MKGSTHLAAGLVAAVVLQTEPTLVVTTGVAIGALLPDIDSSTSLVGRYIPVIPSVLKHRTITHILARRSACCYLSTYCGRRYDAPDSGCVESRGPASVLACEVEAADTGHQSPDAIWRAR